jgi:transposase
MQIEIRKQAHMFKTLPQRWIVERTFSLIEPTGDFVKGLNIILIPKKMIQ